MSHSPSGSAICSYDVFISHRGTEMKLGFANCLHHALEKSGVSSFLDMEKLPIGDDARINMLEAARRATIHVPIFTEIYGSSHWCLDELVIMMDSKRKVIPVYYDVKPENLRIGNGPERDDLPTEDKLFAKHFEKHLHDCEHEEQRIKGWKEALDQASWLEGVRRESYGRRDGALIDDLVKKILDEIFDSLPVDARGVGLDDKVQAVVKLFRLHDQTKVQVVLLWGMGGIGKTTLAEAIYHGHRKDFQAASFVKSCAEKQPWQIQEWLCKDLLHHDKDMRGDFKMGRAVLHHGLREKMVLIVLDDMKDGFSSVQNVINPTRLCPGSLILLTSRDQRVFPDENELSPDLQGVQYELQLMDDVESWQLFCHHAFKTPFARPDLEELAREVVKSCQGLPLALEVLGRLFSTMKRRSQWEETIKKLRRSKNKDILGRLKISYEALDEEEQQMFQEVACFLIGEYEWRAKYFWDGLGYGSETGLEWRG